MLSDSEPLLAGLAKCFPEKVKASTAEYMEYEIQWGRRYVCVYVCMKLCTV